MEEKIVSILNRMDYQKGRIREARIEIGKCKKIVNGRQVYLSTHFIDNGNPEHIGMHLEGELIGIVLSAIEEYYSERQRKSNDYLRELLKELKEIEE